MKPVTNDRVQREKEFHDAWASSVEVQKLRVRRNFDSPTAIDNRYALSEMGDLRGKSLLDLGCGAGETSVYFALMGAKVVGNDISGGVLGLGRRLAQKNASSVDFLQADAGKLPYKDNSFDIIFGNGVLHHVDLQAAAKEIRRVLKPGGKAIFIEPLPYNPLINIYRKMAKGVRTEDEKPLSLSQRESLRPHFSSLKHREFWFLSLLIFLDFYFVKKWHPSKTRYWKKVIEVGPAYRDFFARLQKWDNFLLNTFPFLKPLCWNTVITVQK